MLRYSRIRIKLSTFFRNTIYGEGVNPLKWKILTPILFTSFFTLMVITMAFPFLPQLVKSFGVSEVDAGYKVGILGACLFIGRFFCSFIWGLLSDIFNRRNVVITSGLAVAITTLAFGFTFNYAWAVVTRLLQGLSLGFPVVASAMIADMTDDTNRHLGMSTFLGSYSSAVVVGGSLGGVLAFPVEQYPNVFHGAYLFEQFGVLLPCGLLALCLLISSLSILIYVPKTVKVSTHNEEEKQEGSCSNQSKKSLFEYSEHTYLLGDDKEKQIKYYMKVTNLHNENDNISPKRRKNLSKNSKILSVLRERGFTLSAILYAMYALASTGFEEIFPVYAATSKQYHGYGFSPSLIGLYLFVVAVVTFIMQFTLIPKFVKRFGARKAFMYSSIIKTILLPLVSISEMAIENEYLFWIVSLTSLLILRNTMALCFLCIHLFVNNSVDNWLFGTANGVATSAATLGRIISVPVLGALYSWSLTNIKNMKDNSNALGFPFNHHFVFLLLAVISLACAVYTFILPESLDHSYKPRSISTNC